MRNLRRTAWWWVGGGAACALATVVGAATVVGSGPFSMPMPTSPPKEIWTGPATTRVGAKVKANSGTVKVQGTVAGTVKPLGMVSAGVDCVFEGNYDKIELVGYATPTDGTYEVRAPTDATSGDRLVGAGSITFAATGGVVGVYASDAPSRRLAKVQASGGAVGIRSSRTGADLVSVDAGDGSLAILSSTTGYFLSATNGATGAWEIQAVHAACGPFTLTATGATGDTDGLSLDGQVALSLTVTNPGPAVVRVTRQVAGQAATTSDVPPGTSLTEAGAFAQFSWSYVGGATTVSVSATIQ